MKWLNTSDPETGYLVTEITENRLDGISKITAQVLGIYSVVEADTIHVVIPKNDYENHHDVFTSVSDAREFIQNHVLSKPPK